MRSLHELGSVDDFLFVPQSICIHDREQPLRGSIAIKRGNHHEADLQWNGSYYELVTDLMTWTGPDSVQEFLRKLHQRYAHNTIKKISSTYESTQLDTNKLSNGSIQIVISGSI